jgi:hypothetical protein
MVMSVDMPTAESNSGIQSTIPLADQYPAPPFSPMFFIPTLDVAHLEQTTSATAPSLLPTGVPLIQNTFVPAPQPTMNHVPNVSPNPYAQDQTICNRNGCSSGPFATRTEWK